jgi:hypothetical protein
MSTVKSAGKRALFHEPKVHVPAFQIIRHIDNFSLGETRHVYTTLIKQSSNAIELHRLPTLRASLQCRERASRSCSCSWWKSRSTRDSSSCGRLPSLFSPAGSWRPPCCCTGLSVCSRTPWRHQSQNNETRQINSGHWRKQEVDQILPWWFRRTILPEDVPVPGGNILVAEPWGDIEHDDTALIMDAASETEEHIMSTCMCKILKY